MKNSILVVFFFLGAHTFLNAQNFQIQSESVFLATEKDHNEPKKVVLFKSETGLQKVIFFKTKLQVNTDGTPKSYHPDDIGGNEKAINVIGNGVAVYEKGKKKNLFLSGKENYRLAKKVFADYQRLNYENFPPGYDIHWESVLYSDTSSGRKNRV